MLFLGDAIATKDGNSWTILTHVVTHSARPFAIRTVVSNVIRVVAGFKRCIDVSISTDPCFTSDALTACIAYQAIKEAIITDFCNLIAIITHLFVRRICVAIATKGGLTRYVFTV